MVTTSNLEERQRKRNLRPLSLAVGKCTVHPAYYVQRVGTAILHIIAFNTQLPLGYGPKLRKVSHVISLSLSCGSTVGVDSINSIPNWLLILKEEKFFTRCVIHDSVKKNDKNIFCLDCCTSICVHCSPFHSSHVLLQIRRYMYNEVLRLGDAQTLLNCSLVQPYTTNKAKVVFLKQRPPSRTLKGSGNLCITCDRSLQHPYIFCSLSCKQVHHLVLLTKSGTIKEYGNKYELCVVAEKERSSESRQEIENSQMTIDSISIPDSPSSTSLCTMSGSTSTISWGVTESLKSPTNYTATTTGTVLNRRKGVPYRSPLH
ncbi:hypothetical protein VNO77_41176 [Canavalia gladiata]|uniref:B box-type domain-containing protein n=1 Tax=Canavalia gladiata TaxID=3824 RepID=A0AAN9JZ47_CANGL